MTDEEAYEAHKGLIFNMASHVYRQARRQGKRVPLADIIQTGWLGFFHGKRRWRPDRGANLCTYCGMFARGHISRFVWGTVMTVQKRWEDGLETPREFKHLNLVPAKAHDATLDALVDYLKDKDDNTQAVICMAVFDGFTVSKISRLQGMLIGDVEEILLDVAEYLEGF